MRLRFDATAGGDVRLICMRDTARMQRETAPKGAALVRCGQLQDCIYDWIPPPRPGYGAIPTGRNFTPDARRLLRAAGGVLDREGRERTLFLTGTLPGSTRRAHEALSRFSAWIVSRLGQWLRDRYPGCEFFGVWEYQRRGALHLHAAVRLPTVEQAADLAAIFKHRWTALLNRLQQRLTIDLFGRSAGGSWEYNRSITRTDAQYIQKSVSRYLSKYLSKGSEVCRKAMAFPPTAWYFMSANLREAIAKAHRKIESSAIPAAVALNFFEQAAALVVERTAKVFPVANPWDVTYRGVIGLGEPDATAALGEQLYDLWRVWIGGKIEVSSWRRANVSDFCREFEAISVARAAPD